MTESKAQSSTQKTIDTEFANIISKIENKSVTAEDFNNYISIIMNESTPKSTTERVMRKVRNPLRKGHVDNPTGHQRLSLPSFSDRVTPRRETDGSEQMDHDGAAGHKRSTRTQDTMRRKVSEAVDFIIKHQGRPVEECDISSVVNRNTLAKLAVGLAKLPGTDTNWLLELSRKIDEDGSAEPT